MNADQLIAMIENVLSTTEEASVVAPWLQAAPLFGYGLGYLVLGETRSPLSPHQMLGGVAIVTGTIILSLSDGFRAGGFKLRLAGLMLTCAFILAISTTIFKVFAVEDEFWTTTVMDQHRAGTVRPRIPASGVDLAPARHHAAWRYGQGGIGERRE